MNKKVKLILEDGTEIEGNSFGAYTSVNGEAVFNTAMNGYPENLTDPSYKGQILVITYPIVGNYGVPNDEVMNGLEKFLESSKIQISGIVIDYYSEEFNHWNAAKSLDTWLKENNVPGIYNVDTRMITKKLREHGSMLGKIIADQDIDFHNPNLDNLVDQVSTKEVKTYGDGDKKVVLVDCGVKNNIIRCLVDRGIQVIRVPWNYNFSELEYDGLFISNGPGDPKHCDATIRNLQKALTENKPIFGICLGHQLLGLAAGGDTYKLKYGHRGYNQPVIEKETKKCYITSQNHGYTLNEKMPLDWELTFSNLNDDTCEGIKHRHQPFFSVQFHPEASGGPVDTEYLFDNFIEMIKR